ncbi:MAG: hypothetical protein DWQ47_04760 [Acidobacteria bacterium]|nr:MAG: hypothetical protein DWQ32_08310 [Acidobacteriota bacterium]REK01697.1 MAG: hypothetical protein DWQ38_04745 [Acidobacteriota bacterium]REK14653.1 MAG: hypothetical protein DWQ43_14000 [Acidobacteriota bacterium]REK45368.1 MAG: hypothetical protein DWQ47_04760 [Acidobacteriota bacterium]
MIPGDRRILQSRKLEPQQFDWLLSSSIVEGKRGVDLLLLLITPLLFPLVDLVFRHTDDCG